MTIPHSKKITLFRFLETPKSGSDPDKLLLLKHQYIMSILPIFQVNWIKTQGEIAP